MHPRTRYAAACLSLAVLAGCKRDEPQKAASTAPAASAPAPAPAPSASAAPSTMPSAASDAGAAAGGLFGAPGRVVLTPVVPPLAKQSSLDHADIFGWSADGASFGYCKHSGGLGGNTCVILPREGKPETFGDFDDKKDAIDPALHAKLEARKKALALTAAPITQSWDFAGDLELTWDSPSGSTVRVGARVKGEAPSFAIVLRDTNPGAEDGSSHPEIIALSADGTQLGAIAHSFHGEYSDTFTAKVMPVARMAALAYNDAGFAHHKKKEYPQSAALFAKAAAADPTFPLGAYDLACAYARLGDPQAERALGDALKRAGDGAAAMKKQALADEDFSSVKTAPWFVALTKG